MPVCPHGLYTQLQLSTRSRALGVVTSNSRVHVCKCCDDTTTCKLILEAAAVFPVQFALLEQVRLQATSCLALPSAVCACSRRCEWMKLLFAKKHMLIALAFSVPAVAGSGWWHTLGRTAQSW